MANAITIKDKTVKIGDTIKVHYTFKEGDKRSKGQNFEGVLIKIRGRENNKMFTIRKMGKDKIGIERIFPLLSPFIDKVERVKEGSVRRSKLYYIRSISEATLRDRVATP